MDSLRWAAAHPAEAAWAVFGALSLLVAAYRSQEAKIHAYVAKTPNKTDDKLVRWLDALVAIFAVLRLFVPHLLGRQTAPPPSPPAANSGSSEAPDA